MNGKLPRDGLIQFVKFNLVGVLNTLVDFLLFTLLIGLGVHYLAAQCVSYAGGMTNSYLFNRYWTFSSGKGAGGWSQFVRFALVNGVTLGMSLILLFWLGERLGLHPLLAKVLVVGFTMVFNFVGTKFWVFRQKGNKP